MLFQWSKIRKLLEDEFLCDKLKGRVRYFCTRYHHSPDERGRMAILADEVERVVASDEIESMIQAEHCALYAPDLEEIIETYARAGQFSGYDFQTAILRFLESPIEDSLASSDYLQNLLAILDRRVGKRRLAKIREEFANGKHAPIPHWLRLFYNLRLEAEGMDILPSDPVSV